MSDLLSNGTSGLLAFQRALGTTSHNIANANTPGYSRQRVDLQARPGTSQAGGYDGNGVSAIGIERMQDEFAAARVLQSNSDYASQSTHHAMASRIDNLVAGDALSLTPAMNSFFNAIQDANADPDSPASRQVVLAETENVASRFRSLQQQFDDTQAEVNERLTGSVSEINELTAAIGNLNRQITGSGLRSAGQLPNDLLDQRDSLMESLSEHLGVTTNIQDDGAINVFTGNGAELVVGTRVNRLRTSPDPASADRMQIELLRGNQWQAINSRIEGGTIGGLRDFERDTLSPAMNQLGRIALSLSSAINTRHAQGIDLNGNAGGAIFSGGQPVAAASSSNTGTGALSVTIDDTSALEATEYLLRFDGSNYRVTRQSDGSEVTGTLPMSIDGLTITPSGTPAAGDVFNVSATRRAAAFVESSLGNTDSLALASPLKTSSSIDNLGEARVSAPQVLDAADTALNDSVDIVFTSDTTFDVIDIASGTPLATAQPYSSDTAIQFNGWEVSISGQVRNGDVHHVERNTDGFSSNVNGLSLTGVQTANDIVGTASLNDAYGALVTRVGGQTRTLQTRSNATEVLRNNAIDREQSVSGVNLDEEAVNLSRYQQAYQASAQIIATADTLFQTLLGAVAR